MRHAGWVALSLLLGLAGCARHRTSAEIIRRLQERAAEERRPELDRVALGGAVAVPFQRVPRKLVLPMQDAKLPAVAARIDGRDAVVILDTGAGGLLLGAAWAREAETYVPPGDPVPVVTPGGLRRSYRGAVEILELDGFPFGPARVLISAERRFRSGPAGRRLPFDGAVGCAVLAHFRAVFDFERREVRLFPHAKPGGAALLFARCHINDRSFLLLVDSGADEIHLEPSAAQSLGLIGEPEARRLHEEGGLGPKVLLESLRVAGRAFNNLHARVSPTFDGLDREATPDVKGPVGGLLGLAALGPLVWTLDFQRKTLSVRD
ncbi:MAG: aspartyl protease family protein [Planctomycetota bacterium]